MNKIYHGDNLEICDKIQEKVSLIYIDPPFNTGKVQKLGKNKYEDTFEKYEDFLILRISKYLDKLTDNGSIFIHLDHREVHYIKVAMDKLLGRDHFMNEIIWAYDFGARQKNKWPTKHDSILWYAKDSNNYIFNYNNVDRIPYMTRSGLVSPDKIEKGKTITDVWWNTIVPTNGKERVGYPTQKPLGIIERIIKVHSNPGDFVLDFFAGSGTLGEAALNTNRNFILVDSNQDAIKVMKQRFENKDVEYGD